MREHLDGTRLAYDTVAADYARRLPGLEAEQPPELAFLATFAELSAGGRVGAGLPGAGPASGGRDGVGQDGGGPASGGRDGVGRVGGGQDGVGRDGVGRDGVGQDGAGQDGAGQTGGEMVSDGRVGDLGCGAGRVTAHLADQGLDVFGLDLSAGMIAEARRAHPKLPFAVASLTALPLADGSLAGALAWYSIVHTPPVVLPVILAELTRVLARGGHLLLAFQAGGTSFRRDTAYGRSIPLDWHLPDPDTLTADLAALGVPVTARLVREPVAAERFPQACLLARKA